jgi:cyclic-di-GMP-binding protein
MPSFDIVSKVNFQEVDNAFQQAKKEIDQRYDFKGTETLLEKLDKEQALRLRSTTENRLEAAREVIVQRLARRGVSLRSVKYGPVEQTGKLVQQSLTFAQGIEPEKAKAIVKLIKDSKIKVQGAIQGDSLRVSGKNRDDLQAAMKLVRGQSEAMDVDIGFENFRD